MEKLDRICQIGADVVDTIRDEHQKRKEEEFLRTLESGATDYLGGMEFNPEPVQGTCQWFYNDESLAEWLKSSSSEVFWVTAGPGCGKSVLTRSLIKNGHLESNTTKVNSLATIATEDATLAYFFFKDEGTRRNRMSSAMSAILHQIFSKHQNLVPQSYPAFKQAGTALTESFDKLWEILVKTSQNTKGDLICVLDALDECNKDDRKHFLRCLERLYADERLSSSANLKFFITSRPYDDIEKSFRSRQSIKYFRFDADDRYEDISNDINLVIDARISSFASEFNETDLQKIAAGLKSRGTHTYLWLHLTLGMIEDDPSEYSRYQDIEALLSEIPSELSGTYEKILSKTKSEEKTNLLLQIILAADSPLTLDEANYALTLATAPDIESCAQLDAASWQHDFKTAVKNFCGLIISVYDDRLSFIHLTAREFLVKKTGGEGRGEWEGRFGDNAALHAVLARSCMQYLLLSDFTSRILSSFDGELKKYKFLLYSARHWPRHFKAMDQAASSSYLPQARNLCNTFLPASRTWGPWYLRYSPTWWWRVYNSFRGWSSLAVASFVGIKPLVEDLIGNGADMNELCCGYGSALHSAIAGEQREIAKYLIAKGVKVDERSPGGAATPMDMAVAMLQDLELTQLLLANGASPLENSEYYYSLRHDFREQTWNDSTDFRSFTILSTAAILPSKDIFYCMLTSLVNISTHEAILLAASDSVIAQCGSECVALTLALLDDSRLGDALSEDNLPGLLSVPSVAKRVFLIVCQKRREYLFMKEAVLKLLSKVEGAAVALRQLVLESETPNSHINHEVLQVVAEHYEPETLELFIKHSPDNCEVKELLRAAILNKRHCYTMPLVILKFAKEAITSDEELQVSLLKRMVLGSTEGKATIDTLLRLSPLTDRVKRLLIRSAMECHGNSDDEIPECFRAVLDRVGYVGIVDRPLLKIAVEECTAEIVEVALQYSAGLSIAAEEFLEAAANNIRFGKSAMKFILQKYKAEAVITPRVILAAARWDFVDDMLRFLLETRPGQVEVTVDVLSYVRTRETFETLLRLRSDEVPPIASAALHIMACRFDNDFPTISNMLECFPPTWFQPTEELVLDVLGSHWMPAKSLSSLINAFGDQIAITEPILASAASSLNGDEFLSVLQIWKPSKFVITSWVVEKAATNGSHALRNLLKYSGGKLVVDETLWRLATFKDTIMRGSLKELEQLWAEEPVADVTDERGRTALIKAVRARASVETVRFLLEVTGADVNATDRADRSALYYAVQGWDLELVQTLVVAGADPREVDVDGETPLSLVEKLSIIDDLDMDSESLLLVLKDEWYAGFLTISSWSGGEDESGVEELESCVEGGESDRTWKEVNWALEWTFWILIRILDWMPWVDVWIDRVWKRESVKE